MGRALSLHYAASGWYIIGTDIDEGSLAETKKQVLEAGGGFRASVADLSRHEDRQKLLGIIHRRKGADLFIHNAGLNLVGPFGDLRFGEQQELIKVNLVAPMNLTRGLLKHQLLRDGSTLVFMSSLSHFISYPGASVYAGSKDGLAHYARSLRMALKPRNIHVLTVYPGPVRTAMAERCSPDGARGARNRMPADKLARLMAQAVEQGRAELIPGMRNRILAKLGKRAPNLSGIVMKRLIYNRLDPAVNPDGLRSR